MSLRTTPLQRRDNPYVYRQISFPANLDYFFEAAGGQQPANTLYARYVNKVEDAITAVEQQVQYTPTTAAATGSLVYTVRALTQLQVDANLPGLNYPVQLAIDPTFANWYFGGSPFNRQYPLFASAQAWGVVNGAQQFYFTRAAVNVGQENGNLACTVNVVQPSRWRRGDTIATLLAIGRP